ncbi:MAG: non-canonical purine NTP pyrophosphatase [Pedosphaera sp.]|nr:non-canonical purine NTP pyrophosphatase [Pedosphaera sp.]
MTPTRISIVIATGNLHKVGEIQSILGTRVECRSLRDFPAAPAPVEDAETFAGNAAIKAISLSRWLIENRRESEWPLYVLADDSGLEVRTLAWAPGVHSARFFALDDGRVGNASDGENNAKLIRLLATVPAEQRQARFRCVLAWTPVMAAPAGEDSARWLQVQTRHFEGRCEGRIAERGSGASGFGYDPLFVPDGFDLSFAELGVEAKNRISHRARALAHLNTDISREATNR